jgi:hypothetical protein
MVRLAAETGFGSLSLIAPAAGFPPPQLFRAENLYLFLFILYPRAAPKGFQFA